jgi:hypothetical protein
MDNNRLISFSKGLLRANNIRVSKKCDYNMVINHLANYLDALVFNIVSIACIVSIINKSKKIDKETLPIIRSYIEDKCNFKYAKKMSGGAVYPSSFYGATETAYSENNKGGDILGINWSAGIIRPEIGTSGKFPMEGGGSSATRKISPKASYNYIRSHVYKILKYHNIQASKFIISELIFLIDHHIKCLVANIKKCDKELTLSCLNKIINKNKILAPLK